MTYQCPGCKSYRNKEKRETIKNELILTITYDSGCELRLVRKGNVWKVMAQICKSDPNLGRL